MKSYRIVITCPHCGKEKELVQVRGGFVFRRFQWWDMRTATLPSSFSLSKVQHCPHCGRYFMLHDGDYTEIEVEKPLSLFGEATDLLSYEKTHEAWEQLRNQLHCAEFIREAGEFERAMEILNSIPYPSTQTPEGYTI